MADLNLVKDCIAMLEKYYDTAKALPNDNSKVAELKGDDLAKWKGTYYPQLSKPEIIKDATFFQNPVSNANLGIGADGQFCKVEYVQFLYRAYKYLKPDFNKNPGTVYLKQSVDILEKYVARFENKGTADGATVTPEAKEVELWKSSFYPFFVKTGLLPDGAFFGDVKKTPNLGIGADGVFYAKELLHFLYQAYKFVYTYFG